MIVTGPSGDRSALSEISARILEGVAAGMSSRQLASRIGMSHQGVDYHIGVLLRILRVPNRTALVSRAYQLGILSTDCWPPRVTAEHQHCPSRRRRA
ncbi:LuxR C-terminal-related transcriptional regulator [Streptomyces cavernae]|uniref:LuxR C-terminal-related transcriptional regulator n=1 Tax=Streptomyces cavernae TaxID=2259034 RepID=UPI000FEB66E9